MKNALRLFISLSALAAASGIAVPVAAGWSVINVPGPTYESTLCAGLQHGASVCFCCCEWFSSAAAPMIGGTPLYTPPGKTVCYVNGICNGEMAGQAYVGSKFHAGYWDAASGGFTDLSPIGVFNSAARGVYNGQFVGEICPVSGIAHACLWNGTSASIIDLNPGPQYQSGANGIYAGWEVGEVSTDSWNSLTIHGALWNGSSANWIDMGLGSPSAIFKDQVVGYDIGGSACVWSNVFSGTGMTMSPLLPAQFSGDYEDFADAPCICNGVQVGWVARVNYYTIGERQYQQTVRDENDYAALWRGTAESFVNLDYIAGSDGDSEATGVYASDSGEIWVSGEAGGTSVLWHFVPGISGTVALNNYVGDITQVPVTVEIQSTSSTTAIETDTVSLDSAGNYSFIPTTQGLSGTYNVVAKASHWLAQCVPTVLDTDGSGVASFSLINGDANGDNFIEDQDYSLLGVSWYSSVGDANYNVNADLNGDGFVEDQDYSIMGMNWYASGDPF